MEISWLLERVSISSNAITRGDKMNVFLIILIASCVVFELIFLIFHLRMKKKKKEKMRKSLYKLIETRVLEQSLKYRITSGQAAMYECAKPFLHMEFLNTQPQISYLFPLDEWITIGRNKENKVCVHNETFSRLHCKIGMINNVLLLQDQGSANGTRIKRGFLKKIDVAGGRQEVLQSGDCIKIGDYKMKIRIIYGSEAMG